MKNSIVALGLGIVVVSTSCVVINQGEVGVKRTFGKFSDSPLTGGVYSYNPFTTEIVRITVQTRNMEVNLKLPSKEGLTVESEISILYHVLPEKAPDLLRNVGIGYERNVILPVFRSASADVCANFFAKDMHTGKRAIIEEEIKAKMTENLNPRGIIIEAVLMKSVQLPRDLSAAIEEKLRAEQESLRMQFTLDAARQEAERKRIEAAGVRDAQQIISEGLNDRILQFMSIEGLRALANSPNAKIIISDGDLPKLQIQTQ